MGRFIAIDILCDIVFLEDGVDRSKVSGAFPDSVFDYSHFDDEKTICLRDDIPGAEIAALRKSVLEFMGLPEDKEEDKLANTLSESTIDELKNLAERKEYVTFQESTDIKYLLIDGKPYKVSTFSFLIYIMGVKFYPKQRYYTHEIIEKMDMLIGKHLKDHPLKSLVKTIVTL